jgi:hypothetical protein
MKNIKQAMKNTSMAVKIHRAGGGNFRIAAPSRTSKTDSVSSWLSVA